MRKALFLVLLFCSAHSWSQGIVVDTTTLSIPELVRKELLQNACAEESNFKFSSRLGIGKFSSTNPNFPFQEGIIIRNGIAKYTEGTYTGANESSQLNTNGDADLQAISNSNGQITPITDVSLIQFDFTPVSSNFSFDFLFASNEYGEFQCGFSDVFGFILTDLTTGISTNLAVLPQTNQAVSVLNIRDNKYNSSCVSANASFFDNYNVGNPTTSAMNMRGETKVLTASAAVVPNRTYQIKLAIGDYNDSNYDSAVFIKGGSFKTSMNLGPDQTLCKGEQLLLQSDLIGNYSYIWTLNGVEIIGETNASLTVTQAGTYGVTATLSGCVIKDEVTIFELALVPPKDLVNCYNASTSYPFDLTQNNAAALGLDPAAYSLLYFDSLSNANANGPAIPANQLTNYITSAKKTIYIKPIHITNNTLCNDLVSFELQITAPLNIINPPEIKVCDTANGRISVDLTSNVSIILNGLPTTDYTLWYYFNLIDANNKTNGISNPRNFIMTLTQSPLPIWVRVESNNESKCYSTATFDVIVTPLANVDRIADVIACNSYTLPNITNGKYYTGPNATGTQLNIGDVITTSGTYYIYNDPSPNSICSNETSFLVTLAYDLSFLKEGCGQYVVPDVLVGEFYTQSNGGGSRLPAGTILTTSQTIFYYAEINGVVCRDEAVAITVFVLPLVEQLADVVTCNSYVLPTITKGNYYTQPGGSGTNLSPGSSTTATQTIYIFTDDGQCTNETSFRIVIIDPSLFGPVSRCGSYILPPLSIGGYYDQPRGNGNAIPAGTQIISSQTVYFFATTTTTPNCTDTLKIDITIKPLPLVDKPDDVFACEEYILPALTNGKYYTLPNGGGNQLQAGTRITINQTIYVFASSPECSNEHAFKIEIRPKPVVDNFTDIISCTSFPLPRLTNGTYYTASGGSNGVGTVIPEGTLISTSQTVFIYNEWNDFKACSNESFFKINIKKVDIGSFADVNTCDSYTLPPLTVGGYYLSPNGKDPIAVGTVLKTTQRIYVFAEAGNRITCSSETSFMVNISNTPTLQPATNITACVSYILPPLSLGAYYSNVNKGGTPYQAGDEITASQKMYIYAASPTNPNCFSEITFEITIFPLKDLAPQQAYICVDFQSGKVLQPAILASGLDPNDYNVDWYLSGTKISTGVDFSTTQEGVYTMRSQKITPSVGADCGFNPATYTVEKSSPAEATIMVSSAFTNSIDIEVTVKNGLGSYEFKLDDGDFQTGSIFYDVDSGAHTVTIKDIKGGCDDRILVANVLKYPKFFTPNNDGFNDTWNIMDLAFQPDAIIQIFDRYGKFIKEIKPSGPGWDGNYNGRPLPSTDYWFLVTYLLNGEQQVFKSHFSMKR
ncbi:conserved exported hypothetical protein [Flavobacterium sp. 9R]|uniref:T9SS type B sorting domain-containing protein n=1 Tax=Flavobacterium sp. 9R TaxID=2653143 RepID=UPI0012F0DEA7|nr:choice-of-anchor L domain-containing protein [Flavobacterium sp. 9R]VXB36236.1 conserved exported hypothetical protein [Flavobacterium sp. 9R]